MGKNQNLSATQTSSAASTATTSQGWSPQQVKAVADRLATCGELLATHGRKIDYLHHAKLWGAILADMPFNDVLRALEWWLGHSGVYPSPNCVKDYRTAKKPALTEALYREACRRVTTDQEACDPFYKVIKSNYESQFRYVLDGNKKMQNTWRGDNEAQRLCIAAGMPPHVAKAWLGDAVIKVGTSHTVLRVSTDHARRYLLRAHKATITAALGGGTVYVVNDQSTPKAKKGASVAEESQQDDKKTYWWQN